ncbi:hypothetical protein ACI2K4_23520 [Micromonospora sp. NPDC050397]|uniref:hypothetical protein n=1 Tax=Micromonospora sp. NPDC050397 TaxID=3364279 RepID=UPI00384A77D8
MPAAPTLSPTVDPAAAYPELVSFRAALRGGDWDGVRALADAQDPAGRTRLIALAADHEEAGPLPRQRLAADPADTLAGALLGARLVMEAWEVRSSRQAQFVSQARFARFHEILRDAERVLIDAAAYDPTDAAVWTHRMPTARGLQLGLSEARRRYDRLAEHHPHHLPAQSHLLQQLAPKWGGTLEAMHDFARTEMLAAPEGAPNAVLVVEAHLEQWMQLSAGERNSYLTRTEVREQIREAAARSVQHPSYRRTVGWVQVENYFAFMFGMIGDDVAAARQFAAIGHLASESPWHYLGDPLTVFAQRRDKAVKRGGAR